VIELQFHEKRSGRKRALLFVKRTRNVTVKVKTKVYGFRRSGSRGKLETDIIIILSRWSPSLNLRYCVHPNFMLVKKYAGKKNVLLGLHYSYCNIK
jgi:hypothetical protein